MMGYVTDAEAHGAAEAMSRRVPSVSIIIPALNEASLIGSAIDSAMAADPLEIIVVDGGSTDGTQDLIRRRPCIVLDCQPGRAIQQNLGARHARGDVLLFLHADSKVDPSAVKQLEQALRNSHIISGAFRQVIDAPQPIYGWIARGNSLRVQLLGLPYGDQGIFVRRRTFEELGGFPEVTLMEDVLLSKALRRIARPILLPGPVYVSPRRWQRRGPVRQTLRNWSLLGALFLGVHPSRLAPHYDNYR
jgi:rSAM/selenodomain-associated transferase 2